MPSLSFVTVDVFTDTRFGGNPLAVVLDAQGLSGELMQQIAREFNYSETTFVLPPADSRNTAHVRIFTPTDELPFAGHPNVGTAYVLGTLDTSGRRAEDRMRFEEKAGLVEIDLVRDQGKVAGARIRAPRGLEIGPRIDRDTIAACASLTRGDILSTHHEPCIASVGLGFVFAELGNLDALGRARPSESAFAVADQRYPHPGDHFSLFLYVRSAEAPSRLRARMFSPLSNIPEDPATGSAAAAIGALLTSLRPEQDLDAELVIEQGVEMGRRSVLELLVEKRAGVVTAVRVAGRCVPIMRGTFDL